MFARSGLPDQFRSTVRTSDNCRYGILRDDSTHEPGSRSCPGPACGAVVTAWVATINIPFTEGLERRTDCVTWGRARLHPLYQPWSFTPIYEHPRSVRSGVGRAAPLRRSAVSRYRERSGTGSAKLPARWYPDSSASCTEPNCTRFDGFTSPAVGDPGKWYLRLWRLPTTGPL